MQWKPWSIGYQYTVETLEYRILTYSGNPGIKDIDIQCLPPPLLAI